MKVFVTVCIATLCSAFLFCCFWDNNVVLSEWPFCPQVCRIHYQLHAGSLQSVLPFLLGLMQTFCTKTCWNLTGRIPLPIWTVCWLVIYMMFIHESNCLKICIFFVCGLGSWGFEGTTALLAPAVRRWHFLCSSWASCLDRRMINFSMSSQRSHVFELRLQLT